MTDAPKVPEELSAEELAELARLEAARTQGEWSAFSDGSGIIADGYERITDAFRGSCRMAPTDAAFIAASANAMPRLLAHIASLTARVAEQEIELAEGRNPLGETLRQVSIDGVEYTVPHKLALHFGALSTARAESERLTMALTPLSSLEDRHILRVGPSTLRSWLFEYRKSARAALSKDEPTAPQGGS